MRSTLPTHLIEVKLVQISTQRCRPFGGVFLKFCGLDPRWSQMRRPITFQCGKSVPIEARRRVGHFSSLVEKTTTS